MKSSRIIYGILLLLLISTEIYVNNVYSLLILLVGIFVPLLSVVFCILSRNSLQMTALSDDTVEKGNSIKLSVTLKNKSFFPIASISMLVGASNTLTGTTNTKRVFSNVSGKGMQECAVEIGDAQIGKVFVSISDVFVYDIFKLIKFNTSISSENVVFVTPVEKVVDALIPKAEETMGESIKFSEEFPGSDPTELFDVHQYEIGDDVRKIHWKLSEKTDDIYVKDFSKPLNYSTIILLELNGENSSALETAVEFAINLSRDFLMKGIMNSILWYDTSSEEFCDLNISSFEDLESAVIRIISSSCYVNRNESLEQYVMSSGRDLASTVFYVTPFVLEDKVQRMSIEQQTVCYKANENGVEIWRTK